MINRLVLTLVDPQTPKGPCMLHYLTADRGRSFELGMMNNKIVLISISVDNDGRDKAVAGISDKYDNVIGWFSCI